MLHQSLPTPPLIAPPTTIYKYRLSCSDTNSSTDKSKVGTLLACIGDDWTHLEYFSLLRLKAHYTNCSQSPCWYLAEVNCTRGDEQQLAYYTRLWEQGKVFSLNRDFASQWAFKEISSPPLGLVIMWFDSINTFSTASPLAPDQEDQNNGYEAVNEEDDEENAADEAHYDDERRDVGDGARGERRSNL